MLPPQDSVNQRRASRAPDTAPFLTLPRQPNSWENSDMRAAMTTEPGNAQRPPSAQRAPFIQ